MFFRIPGAAANLTQTGGEGGGRSFTFDVLAASGGGKNTTLCSVDDGTTGDNNPAVAVNKAFAGYDTDLLYKDAAAASWQAGGDTSAAGAHVWIGADGKIHYDASNIDAQIQSLAAGEHFIDTFEYTIKMANGTLSVGHLTVDIVGENDAAVITGNDSANLTEGNNAATISTSGKLDVSDVDHDQSNFQAQWRGRQSPTSSSTQRGTGPTRPMARTASSSAASTIPKTSWSKSPTAPSTLCRSTSWARMTSHFAGVDSGTLLEAAVTPGTAHAAGQLLVLDVNIQPRSPVTRRQAMARCNRRRRELDLLSRQRRCSRERAERVEPGVARRDHGDDGRRHHPDIDITINGANDAATFAGADSGTALEARHRRGTRMRAATARIGRRQLNELHRQTRRASYGTFAIDAAGNWTYDLDNSNAAVNGLNASSPALHDVITVTTADGTTHDIDVTINGANDAATFAGRGQRHGAGGPRRTAGGAPHAAGQLLVPDVDSSTNYHRQHGGELRHVRHRRGRELDLRPRQRQCSGERAQRIEPGTARRDHGDDGRRHHPRHRRHHQRRQRRGHLAGGDAARCWRTSTVQRHGRHAAGQLLVSDVDSSTNFTVQHGGELRHVRHRRGRELDLHLDNGNAAVNGLNALSPALHDVITVTTADGTTHDIDITINGANDAATFAGVDSGTVLEATQAPPAARRMRRASCSYRTSTARRTSPATPRRAYGTFAIDAAGNWTYDLDNGNERWTGSTHRARPCTT